MDFDMAIQIKSKSWWANLECHPDLAKRSLLSQSWLVIRHRLHCCHRLVTLYLKFLACVGPFGHRLACQGCAGLRDNDDWIFAIYLDLLLQFYCLNWSSERFDSLTWPIEVMTSALLWRLSWFFVWFEHLSFLNLESSFVDCFYWILIFHLRAFLTSSVMGIA